MPRHHRLENPPVHVPRAVQRRALGGGAGGHGRALAPAVAVAVGLAALTSAVGVQAVAASASAYPDPIRTVIGCVVPVPILSTHPKPTASERHEADEASEHHHAIRRPSHRPTAAATAAGRTPRATTPTPGTPVKVPAVPYLAVPTLEAPDGTSSSVTAAGFIDSVGINVHPNYIDTTYFKNGSAQVTLDALERLGIEHVRTRIAKQPSGAQAAFVDGLAAKGIGLDAVVGTPDGRWDTYSTGQSAEVAQAVTSGFYKGKVEALEMPNEWDNNGGGAWSGSLSAFEQEYVPALARTGIPIFGSSMAQPGSYSDYLPASSDEIRNIHPYAGGSRMPESDVIPSWVSQSGQRTNSQKVVATEFGWHNALNHTGGVSEAKSAAYLLRALLWNRTHGVARSYIYELFDQKPEPAMTNREMHWGLVAVTGGSSSGGWVQREKPAFTQLRGMLAFLRDSGTAGKPISYSMVGGQSVYAVPMARSDGSTDIAIWQREDVDSNGHSASSTVSLAFDAAVKATVYDTQTGTTSTPAGAGTTRVQVPVDGSVSIVRVTPTP